MSSISESSWTSISIACLPACVDDDLREHFAPRWGIGISYLCFHGSLIVNRFSAHHYVLIWIYASAVVESLMLLPKNPQSAILKFHEHLCVARRATAKWTKVISAIAKDTFLRTEEAQQRGEWRNSKDSKKWSMHCGLPSKPASSK